MTSSGSVNLGRPYPLAALRFHLVLHRVREQGLGPWNVLLGVLLGAALFLWQLGSNPLYESFMEGLVAGTATMVAVGIGQRFFRGAKVEKAQLPGGPSVEFEKAAELSVKAVEQGVSDLNNRVTKQMDDVNKRLFDLETEVFKGLDHDSDT